MAINELIEGYVSRQEAIAKGLKFYFTGKPCKHRHVAERFVKGYACCVCRLLTNNSEEHKIYTSNYNKSEQGKERKRAFCQTEEWQIYNSSEKRRKESSEYKLKRIKVDENFKLQQYLRSRINKVIRRDQRTGSSVNDLGCSLEFFKEYIAKQFKDDMTWGNYGKVWHIDHIEPLCSFDLTDHEQFLKACHYTNLQPLFAVDNLKKRRLDLQKAIKIEVKEFNVWKDLFE